MNQAGEPSQSTAMASKKRTPLVIRENMRYKTRKNKIDMWQPYMYQRKNKLLF